MIRIRIAKNNKHAVISQRDIIGAEEPHMHHKELDKNMACNIKLSTLLLLS